MIKNLLNIINEEIKNIEKDLIEEFKDAPFSIKLKKKTEYFKYNEEHELVEEFSELTKEDELSFHPHVLYIYSFIEYEILEDLIVFSHSDFLSHNNEKINIEKIKTSINLLKKDIIHTMKENTQKEFKMFTYISIKSDPIEILDYIIKQIFYFEGQISVEIKYEPIF